MSEKGRMTKQKLLDMNPNKEEFIEEYKKQANEVRKALGNESLLETEMLDAWIPMPDGVRLFAHIHRPKTGKKWPVIVIHNPYISNFMMESIIDGPVFAKHGYIVVDVNVRGTVLSEGEWTPYENRRQDGKAIIDWVGEQDWCDGNIGTYGGSYLGYTQLCIADYEHPMLKTMFVMVWGCVPYNLVYRRGMYRPDMLSWAAQMMEDNRYRLRNGTENQELSRKAFEAKPPVMLGEYLKGKRCGWYADMVMAGKSTDAYWNSGSWKELQETLPEIKRPVYLMGGWYDVFLRSQMDSYHMMLPDVREKSRFVIGPWWHACSLGGTMKYPNEDRYRPSHKEALKWFDYQLKGKDYPEKLGVIEAYNIGENIWKCWKDEICGNDAYVVYLEKAIDLEHNSSTGKLSIHLPEKNQKITYFYDPANPVESVGGNLLSNNRNPEQPPECSTEQPEPGIRGDVISFLSEPLQEEMCLAGQIEAQLYVSSSAPATAFTVNVMEVFEGGKTMNIRDDITDIRWTDEEHVENYEPGTVRKLTLRLLTVNWMLQKGSRLRIDISSSNFPAYHVHPNTEKHWAEETEKVIAEETIYTGKRYPSCLIFPVLK